MAAELFYQAIQKVPGLTGTRYQDKGRDLYYKLGAPYGEYKGNLQQNSWLLGEINKNNYYSASQPWNAASTQGTTQGAMEGIADAGLGDAAPIENFQDLLPQDQFYGIFDEWTRNFVNEYVLPEWQEKTYNKELENMAMALGNLNKQMGVSGAWRSGTARGSLYRAADESLEQEEQLRQDYQSQISALRDQIQNQWAAPIYNNEMTDYMNSPTSGIDLTGIGDDMVDSLSGENGVSGVPTIGDLIGDLSAENIVNRPQPPVHDWSAPIGDLSLINQYRRPS